MSVPFPVVQRRKMVSEFPARCRENGLNLTPQRLAVYEALAMSAKHPSAEEIHQGLRRRYPSLSLQTVYNTLEALHAARLVSLLNVVHERARYDAETDRHHHLICERCKVVRDVHDNALDRLRAPRPDGFQVRSHSVHFYGLCPRCAAAGEEPTGAKREKAARGPRPTAAMEKDLPRR